MSALIEPAPHDACDVTVAFDWNGTLADDLAHAVAATNVVLSRAGCEPLTEHGFRSAFTLPLDAFFRALGLGEDKLRSASTLWNAELGASPVKLMDGATETLQTLGRDGVRLGVVSAASASAIDAGVHHLTMELGTELDFVASSVSDKLTVIECLVRETQGAVLYVGDTEYDIISARRGGAQAVGFGAGYRPRPALEAARPEWLVDDLRDIVAIARAAARWREGTP